LIAETLLAAAFNAIACQSRVLTLLRRVYSGSYDRLTAANPPESHPPSGEMQPDHGEGAGSVHGRTSRRRQAAERELQ
jgi:hypothetical protein